MSRGALAPLRAVLPEALKEPARLVVARRLERRARRTGAVRGAALVLHAVGPRQGDAAHEVDPPFALGRFEAMVAYLSRRYRLVRASELVGAARARRAGDAVPIALTFDDDLPSHVDDVAPVLARHDVPGTAFLCGARRPFWWHLLQAAVDTGELLPGDLPGVEGELVADALRRRPWALARLALAVELLPAARRDALEELLTERGAAAPQPLDAAGVGLLRRGGWEIGFHTRRHHALPALAEEDLSRAIVDGRDALGPPAPRTFAYPHGKAGPREGDAVRAAGYVAAFTGAATVFTERTDPHLIGRLQPSPSSLGRLALQLARALAPA